MFRSRLAAQKMPDGQWELLRPLVYDCDLTGKTYRVPKGFKTDYCSVPRLPFAYWLFGGVADEAGCLHDYFYRTPGVEPRHIADAVFLEAMSYLAVPRWRRAVMFYGVRLFGWTSYAGEGVS